MNYKKIVIFFLEMFLILLLICGCSRVESLSIDNKIDSEIEYVKDGVEIFLKNCEQGEYIGDNEDILWNDISEENTIFINSIPVIEADLDYYKIERNKIDEIMNIRKNIDMYVQKNDLNNLKKEYGKLYINFQNLKYDEIKNFRSKSMEIYINAIDENNDKLDVLIQELENLYSNLKSNNIGLNRINNIISNMRSFYNEKNYKNIQYYSLKIVDYL